MKYLLSLSEKGSFTAAAKANYVTQPAVSVQLRKLQEELGTKLYEVDGRTVRFTRTGEVALGYAERFVRLETELVRAIDDIEGLRKGKIAAGMIDAASIYVLPKVLSRFQEIYPGIEIQLEPEEEADIHIAYNSRGLDTWLYSFADDIVTVKNFTLTVNTDFDQFDFPSRSISASTKTSTDQGWELGWAFANLVSDFDVGVEMPHKLNPGPLASRMSYFAPVSLLFFFTVLVVLGAVSGTNLHPMHYFFLGAAFFAFHLLFAYLVDHVLIGFAFVIAAGVSMALVVSYLWRVVGRRFALREACISQLLFLILFSYAFFFEGYTGLVVTVGSVITLAVLMQVTANLDWTQVFGKKDS